MLKNTILQAVMLVYYLLDRVLWIDLDAFKEFGFGIIMFHTNDDAAALSGKWLPQTSIQLIMFFSRLSTDAEQNYWPTELKIAGFIWIIMKIRHLVKLSKHKVVIQTNYSAIVNIVKQHLIVSTISTMQINLRLVRAS